MSAAEHYTGPPVGRARPDTRGGYQLTADPPPLPTLRPRQRVVVVDAKSRRTLERLDGRTGHVYGHTPAGAPLLFWPDGDHRTYPIDSPRHSATATTVIVEPIEGDPR